jgi:hypothetical protein
MSEAERFFVLTHEYSDKSGFHICGVTKSFEVAVAWYRGNDENHIYGLESDEILPAAIGAKEIKI